MQVCFSLRVLPFLRVIVTALAIAGVGSSKTQAQCYQWIEHASHIPAGNDWGVTALVEHDGALIAGGNFNYMGGQQCVGSARWDGHRWVQLGANASWATTIFEFQHRLFAVMNNGLVELVGNSWVPVAGRPSRQIGASCARGSDVVLLSNSTQTGFVDAWDGTTWRSYPSLEGQVLEAIEFNGQLVVSGNFISSGDVQLSRVAIWDGAAWQPLGTGFDAKVRALAVHNGVLYAGGEFVTASGASALRVAKWDGQSWTQVGAGFSNAVHELRSFGGKLYAGGAFASSGTETVWFSAVLNEDGAWVQVGPPPRGTVKTFSEYNGDLVFGGDNSGVSMGLSGLSTGWLNANLQWQGFGMGLGLGPTSGGYVSTLVSSGGEVYAGGNFNEAGGDLTVARGARWDGERWYAVQPLTASTIPTAFFRYGSDLLLGNSFMPPGGHLVLGPLLRWDGVTWTAIVSTLGGGGTINAIQEWNGQVYAGGSFSAHPGPVPLLITGLARWDGTSISQLGTGISGSVLALTTWNDSMVAAGGLTMAGGQTVNNIARWDGQIWFPMGSGINGAVRAVTVFQGDLIAAGTFSTAGTHSVSNIARWDGTDWQQLGAGLDGRVNALAVFDGALIAGGEFMNAGGQTAKRLARWDGNSWQEFNGGASARVRTLCVHQGELLVGGDFLQLGGVASVYFGRAKTCCGTADFNRDGDFGTDADIEAFFACLAGNCCAACLNSDFNGDGDFGTDGDIEAFFRVLAGGNC